MKKILKYIIVFIILLATYNVLMFLGSLFPSTWIEEKVKESAEILAEEGNIYDFGANFHITNNNYTDALMINEAYSIDNKNPIYSYMAVRKNYKEGQTTQELSDQNGEAISINGGEICRGRTYDIVGELKEFAEGKTEVTITYARYWHGYLPALRTLLIFFNVSQIRNILLIVFIVLLAYAAMLIWKKLGKSISIIFVFSLIVEGYFFVSYSLESASIFIVMMISCIILLKRAEKINDFYLYIFIVASIANFVDYLTVPLITLAMPLYLYLLYIQKYQQKKSLKYYFEVIIKSVFIWGIGYVATWFSKWLLYGLMYDKELIYSAIYQVMYRSVGNTTYTMENILTILGNVTIENVCYIFVCLIVMAGVFIYKNTLTTNIQRKNEEKINIKNKLPILIMSGLPYIWFLLLANHTTGHIRFTYRNMIIFLFGILVFINEIFEMFGQKIANTEKIKYKK